MDNLAASIDQLISLEAIRTLRAKYAMYFDMGEVDALADLFAIDAVCRFGTNFGGDWIGRSIIRDQYAGFVARRPVARFAMQHLATNAWIEFDDPDHARGKWYFTVVKAGQTEVEPYLHMAGRYADSYVRVDGFWLIQECYVEQLSVVPSAS